MSQYRYMNTLRVSAAQLRAILADYPDDDVIVLCQENKPHASRLTVFAAIPHTANRDNLYRPDGGLVARGTVESEYKQ